MVTSWKLYDAIRGMASGSDKASTTTAVYVGRDSDGRDIVRLKGSGISTPVNGSMSASAKEGDTLSVDVSNGRLSVVGNLSDPGVGGEYVSEAVGASESAVREDMGQISTVAEGAAQTARGAASIANATAQHFWVDGQGVHVTQVTQDAFLEEPSGPNQLSNANGILLRDGETYLAAFATDGMSVYDGRGNEESNSFAEFTRDGMRVGYEDSASMTVTPERTVFMDANGDVIGLLGQGDTSVVERMSTLTWTYTRVERGTIFAKPFHSKLVIGQDKPLTVKVTKSGTVETLTFVDEGEQDTLVGPVALTIDSDYDWSVSITSIGVNASFSWQVTYYREKFPPKYVLGNGTATGTYSLSEGQQTTASGEYGSHSEGLKNSATGNASHAEGVFSTASGRGAHAEGGWVRSYDGTVLFGVHGGTASGDASHAQNMMTVASKMAQTALGKYNVEDTADGDFGQYAVMVGNGTSTSNRSNALTVDWSGNVECGTVNGIDIAAAVAGVTVFKGELSSQATLEGADYEAGWYWLVTASGTYAGNHCEPGDMVYAVADKGTAYSDDDFAVVQANTEALTNEEIEELLTAADA